MSRENQPRQDTDKRPALHLSRAGVLHFVLDILPLWERSVLLFPWLMLLIELFTPKSLQDTLRVKCKKVVHKPRISGTSAYRHRPTPGAAGDCD